MHERISRDDATTHQFLQAPADNAVMHSATREIIRQLSEQHGVPSERQLAVECGMSQSTLHRFMKGETDSLEFRHLQAIAKRFQITVSQLIGETPVEADPKIRTVVRAMEAMPEYKKDVLVAASESLLQGNKPH